ncbi:hypothetical protein K1I53_04685 [Streptococcus oralis]|nr:hypothetical protein [Streptococcus oralis]
MICSYLPNQSVRFRLNKENAKDGRNHYFLLTLNK